MIGYGSGDTHLLMHENRQQVDLYGPDRRTALGLLQRAIDEKVVGKDIRVLTYRSDDQSKLIFLYKGDHLKTLLDDLPQQANSKLKDAILDSMKPVDSVGIFVFCTGSRRFLLVERDATIGCFGGAVQEGEEPADAARRTALKDGRFDVDGILIPLVPHNGEATFHPFLIIIRSEFTPKLSSTITKSLWVPFEEIEKLALQSEVRTAVTTEPTLQKIMTAPVDDPEYDFEALAEEIIG